MLRAKIPDLADAMAFSGGRLSHLEINLLISAETPRNEKKIGKATILREMPHSDAKKATMQFQRKGFKMKLGKRVIELSLSKVATGSKKKPGLEQPSDRWCPSGSSLKSAPIRCKCMQMLGGPVPLFRPMASFPGVLSPFAHPSSRIPFKSCTVSP